MTGLPRGWVTSDLGETTDITSGIGFPKSYQGNTSGDLGFYKVRDISRAVLEHNGELRDPEHYVSIAIAEELRGDPIAAGATVFAKIGEAIRLNRRAIVQRPCLVDNNVMAVKARQPLSDRYLFHYMRTLDFAELSRATTVPSLRKSDIEVIELPLAPLPEQKRISDKLDAVLARLDACRERLYRVPAILKRFRQSVLAAATSGALTEDWRHEQSELEGGHEVVQQDASRKRELLQADPSLMKKKSTVESAVDANYLFDVPRNWVFSSWGTVSEWITYGFTRPMPHADRGVSLLTARDIQDFSVDFSRAEYTTEAAFASLSDKDRPLAGDLLLTKDGTIGRAALVQTDIPFCINQSVAVCWLRSTTMSRRYLEVVANAEFTQEFIRDKAKGMAIQHLSITDFAQCPLPVPPLSEQTEIVRRVETLFAYADRIEARYMTAREQVERLTPALLAKAFRGELVPQDPNDEPASVLLDRLRAKRAADSAAGPQSKARARRRKSC